MKSRLSVFLVVLIVCGLFLASNVHSGMAQDSVITVISSDTTWTKADSPYNLTGHLLVTEDVTLTIEAGATVNMNGYEIRVNGTLAAIGSNTDPVHISDGVKIEYTPYSNGWNEEAGTGCIIENAVLKNVDIPTSVALKISNNSMVNVDIVGDSLSILNNKLVDGHVTAGEPTSIQSNNLTKLSITGGTGKVSNNTVQHFVLFDSAHEITGNTIEHLSISSGSPTISNNIIEWVSAYGGAPTISESVIEQLTVSDSSPTILNNTIEKLTVQSGAPTISENTIEEVNSNSPFELFWSGYQEGYKEEFVGFNASGAPTISDNIIGTIGTVGYVHGVHENYTEVRTYFAAKSAKIANNTVREGIFLDCESATVSNNTIHGYTFTHTWWRSGGGISDPGEWITSTFTTLGIVIRSGNVYVSGNTVTKCTIGIQGGTTIGGNVLTNNHKGIVITGDNVTIRNNNITNGDIGISGQTNGEVTIENNIVNNATIGITITSQAVIRNNTLTNNSNASIKLNNCPSVTIEYNNIENYSQYSIYLENIASNIDATNNWWGTTDTQAINLTIRDSKYDFGIGEVSFIPFLTEPNPEAKILPEPEPMQQQPETQPEQPDNQTLLIVASVLAVTICLGLAIYFIKRK